MRVLQHKSLATYNDQFDNDAVAHDNARNVSAHAECVWDNLVVE